MPPICWVQCFRTYNVHLNIPPGVLECLEVFNMPPPPKKRKGVAHKTDTESHWSGRSIMVICKLQHTGLFMDWQLEDMMQCYVAKDHGPSVWAWPQVLQLGPGAGQIGSPNP